MRLRKLLFALMLVICGLGSLNGCTPSENGADGGYGNDASSTDSE